jgi:hypothetical protein
VYERAPAAGALEERDGIDARHPGPAEVKLEEEVIFRQQLFQEAVAVVERSDLTVVVVKAEADAEPHAHARDSGESRDHLLRRVGGRRRLDPAQHEPVCTKRHAFRRERRQPRLERIEPRMPAAGDQAELVQPSTNGRSVVAVQVEDLDTLVAQRGNGAQRPFEITGAVLAHGVQHQADARHATSSPLRCAWMKSRYQ